MVFITFSGSTKILTNLSRENKYEHKRPDAQGKPTSSPGMNQPLKGYVRTACLVRLLIVVIVQQNGNGTLPPTTLRRACTRSSWRITTAAQLGPPNLEGRL